MNPSARRHLKIFAAIPVNVFSLRRAAAAVLVFLGSPHVPHLPGAPLGSFILPPGGRLDSEFCGSFSGTAGPA